ncbi:hypothetical protein D9757_000317 [Collybiopsis confluens]|uniref:Uncharacterized protein n=1 Tax=Collybiopsis confluens TaxID=2823264 RepID=A0A8H5I2F8_9AGAR|nr:hypothetical protein D9757_000317 [Collybiopsis confluens]
MNAPKPCPNVPLPSPPLIVRRRSSTLNAISTWALAVQPGSPAPISPPLYSPTGSPGSVSRRPSLSRRSSRRRPSISHTRARSGSTSFIHLVETPTSANRPLFTPGPLSPSGGFDFDLSNLGYTSVFVHLPHTPAAPSPFIIPVDTTKIPVPQTPPAPPARGLRKFRSLGMLKGNRNRSKSAAPAPRSPASPNHRIAMAAKAQSKINLTPPPSATTFRKAKKASTAAAPPLPPTLSNELLLMQFMGGGSLETHAKRVMEKQAKEVAPAGRPKGAAPVGTVYRDGSGRMWWDVDEAIEYQALLPPASPESPGRTWVIFNSPSPKGYRALPHNIAIGIGEDEERRGSITSSLSSSPSLSVSLSRLITHAPMDNSARAMHLLRLPATELNSSLAAASGLAARNKRNRRRPAPLKLHSSPAVPNANTFDDSFAPSAEVPRSHAGDVSAPATHIEFIASPVKENLAIRPAKLGFKGKAKALFGGLA